MPTVEEQIPKALQPPTDAALAWWNAREDATFEVTGILDPAEAAKADGTWDLRLVLCGGDRCEQAAFRVAPDAGGFAVALADEAGPESMGDAKLDPPPGARRGWLDRTLGQHAFVALVFYRGFW